MRRVLAPSSRKLARKALSDATGVQHRPAPVAASRRASWMPTSRASEHGPAARGNARSRDKTSPSRLMEKRTPSREAVRASVESFQSRESSATAMSPSRDSAGLGASHRGACSTSRAGRRCRSRGAGVASSIVDAKRPPADPRYVIRCLGRYAHRVGSPISARWTRRHLPHHGQRAHDREMRIASWHVLPPASSNARRAERQPGSRARNSCHWEPRPASAGRRDSRAHCLAHVPSPAGSPVTIEPLDERAARSNGFCPGRTERACGLVVSGPGSRERRMEEGGPFSGHTVPFPPARVRGGLALRTTSVAAQAGAPSVHRRAEDEQVPNGDPRGAPGSIATGCFEANVEAG